MGNIRRYLCLLLAGLVFAGSLGALLLSFVPRTAHAQTFDNYRDWFYSSTGSRVNYRASINISESRSVPPTIDIPGNAIQHVAGAPSKIRFKLTSYYGAGKGAVQNIDWFIFTGYAVDTRGNETQLPGLYLNVNDVEGAFGAGQTIVHYSDGSTAANQGEFKCANVLATTLAVCPVNSSGDALPSSGVVYFPGFELPIGMSEGKIEVKESDIAKLFTYAFNAPKSGGDDCDKLTPDELTLTGPKQTPKTLPDGGAAEKLNGNCANLTADGWLAFWGVQMSSEPLNAGCTLTSIMTGGLNIGTIVGKVIICVVNGLLIEPLRWVTDTLIGEILKFSYIEPPPNALASTSNRVPVSLRAEVSPVRGSTSSRLTRFPFIRAAHAADRNLEEEVADQDSPVNKVWQVSRGIVNVVVILALLLIAFSNILHINLNTYAAKIALPGLVLGVIGANASLFIVRFFLDLCVALSHWAAEIGTGAASGSITDLVKTFVWAVASQPLSQIGAIGGGTLFSPFLVIAAIVIAVFCGLIVIVLAWTLLKRTVLLYFMIMISPLAFVSYGVPMFRKYFSTWWNTFLGQLFVFPMLLFGMAAVKILFESIPQAKLQIFSGLMPNITGIIYTTILFAAAIAVLKIPGLATKGALDISSAAKKAFGTARNAPFSAYQGVRDFRKAGGFPELGRRAGQFKDKALAAGRSTYDWKRAGRSKSEWAGMSTDQRNEAKGEAWKKTKSYADSRIGFLTGAVAQPDVFAEAWQDRTKLSEKNRKLYMAKTRTTGMIRGFDADFEKGLELNSEEVRNIPDPSTAIAGMEKPFRDAENVRRAEDLIKKRLRDEGKTDWDDYDIVAAMATEGPSKRKEAGKEVTKQGGVAAFVGSEQLLRLQKAYALIYNDVSRNPDNKGATLDQKKQMALAQLKSQMLIYPPGSGGTPFGVPLVPNDTNPPPPPGGAIPPTPPEASSGETPASVVASSFHPGASGNQSKELLAAINAQAGAPQQIAALLGGPLNRIADLLGIPYTARGRAMERAKAVATARLQSLKGVNDPQDQRYSETMRSLHEVMAESMKEAMQEAPTPTVSVEAASPQASVINQTINNATVSGAPPIIGQPPAAAVRPTAHATPTPAATVRPAAPIPPVQPPALAPTPRPPAYTPPPPAAPTPEPPRIETPPPVHIPPPSIPQVEPAPETPPSSTPTSGGPKPM